MGGKDISVWIIDRVGTAAISYYAGRIYITHDPLKPRNELGGGHGGSDSTDQSLSLSPGQSSRLGENDWDWD